MTIIIFELHGTNHAAGNTPEDQLNHEYRQSHEYYHIGDDHEVFATGFVTELVENHEDDDDEPLIIPLPAFIAMETFILFCNHIVHYQNADKRVGFGRHENKTYKKVYQNHRGYISWARDRDNPSPQMMELLEWVDGINTIRTSWSTSGQDIKRVATYFLIDICSSCGIKSTEVDQVELSPCNRTSWPNVIAFPVWGDVMINDDTPLDAWRDAWEAYDRDLAHGRTVCLNTDLLCPSCVKESPRACRHCNKWECSQCEQDTETPQHFERCNETDPRVFEDDYNIRDETPYKDLNIRPCLHCPRRVCKDKDCGAECIYCHRRACWVCKNRDDIKSKCERCVHIYEEGDWPVAPRWICRSCFDSEPRFCEECGDEPCYDPNASPESSSHSDSEDEGW